MDTFSRAERSEIMRRVHSENTRPERSVRSILHRLGYRFRLHGRVLPGTPDIVLPKFETVVFVHGCFWHRHPNCPRASMPASNQSYWHDKFQRTISRDKSNTALLRRMGWRVVIVWECELKHPDRLRTRLRRILKVRHEPS